MTTKASGMPVPGKLTDYAVEEVSMVDYPANDRPFLLRKNAGQFTPEQLAELKAQGIEPAEAPSLFKQLRSALMSDIQDLFKKLMAPMATQKGTDPMSEQAASEATETKALTDEDLAKVQELIDAALQPWEEKFSAMPMNCLGSAMYKINHVFPVVNIPSSRRHRQNLLTASTLKMSLIAPIF